MAENLKGNRRSSQDWWAVVDRFAASGLGVVAFCEHEGINKSSFGRWRSFLADRVRLGRAAVSVEYAGFVDAGRIGLGGCGQIEVKLDLGGGVVLLVVRG